MYTVYVMIWAWLQHSSHKRPDGRRAALPRWNRSKIQKTSTFLYFSLLYYILLHFWAALPFLSASSQRRPTYEFSEHHPFRSAISKTQLLSLFWASRFPGSKTLPDLQDCLVAATLARAAV